MSRDDWVDPVDPADPVAALVAALEPVGTPESAVVTAPSSWSLMNRSTPKADSLENDSLENDSPDEEPPTGVVEGAGAEGDDEGEGSREANAAAIGAVDEDPVDEDPVDEDPVDEDPVDEDPVEEEPASSDQAEAVDDSVTRPRQERAAKKPSPKEGRAKTGRTGPTTRDVKGQSPAGLASREGRAAPDPKGEPHPWGEMAGGAGRPYEPAGEAANAQATEAVAEIIEDAVEANDPSIVRLHRGVQLPFYRAVPWSVEDYERFYAFAEGIASIAAREPAVTKEVNRMRLTRDRGVDYQQRQRFEQLVSPHLPGAGLAMRADESSHVFDLAYDDMIGLGPLGVPWRDDAVTEILVDSWEAISVERNGVLMPTNLRFRHQTHAEEIARNLAQLVSDRALTPNEPLVTSTLEEARVNFVYGRAVVGSGLAITLRKFRPLMSMDTLLSLGALTEEMAAFLDDVVWARATTMVVGGTGVGKTTLLNALSESIPDNERVITIEDAFELQLRNRFWVRLQTKERASADDTTLIDQERLLKNTLRMRPDRIVVGEIRDDAAAVTMLTAANTGHEGTLSTIHADSPERMVNERLSQMVRGGAHVPDDIAKAQIVSALDVVVQGVRDGERRYISAICELRDDSLVGNVIVPRLLYRGRGDREGNVTFERVAPLSADGRVAHRMAGAGVDVGRWTRPLRATS